MMSKLEMEQRAIIESEAVCRFYKILYHVLVVEPFQGGCKEEFQKGSKTYTPRAPYWRYKSYQHYIMVHCYAIIGLEKSLSSPTAAETVSCTGSHFYTCQHDLSLFSHLLQMIKISLKI